MVSKGGAKDGATNHTIVQLWWTKAEHPVPDNCGPKSW